MFVARYASHYFSKGAICVPLDDQEKSICTLSSHRATRELYAKVPSHRAPVGALCEGSMRIELRSELYAKGALCGSTQRLIVMKRIHIHSVAMGEFPKLADVATFVKL